MGGFVVYFNYYRDYVAHEISSDIQTH